MSSRTARREYFEALAEFERAIVSFDSAMTQILSDPLPHRDPETLALLPPLGPRKPAKRARSIAGASQARRS